MLSVFAGSGFPYLSISNNLWKLYVDLMTGLFVEYISWQNERPCEGLLGKKKKSGKWKNILGYSWGMLRENIQVFEPSDDKDSAESTWLIFSRSKKMALSIIA